MMIGSGVYEGEVDRLRDQLNADAVVLLVIGGKRGNGATSLVGTHVPTPLAVAQLRAFAGVLNQIADDIQYGNLSRMTKIDIIDT